MCEKCQQVQDAYAAAPSNRTLSELTATWAKHERGEHVAVMATAFKTCENDGRRASEHGGA